MLRSQATASQLAVTTAATGPKTSGRRPNRTAAQAMVRGGDSLGPDIMAKAQCVFCCAGCLPPLTTVLSAGVNARRLAKRLRELELDPLAGGLSDHGDMVWCVE